MSEAIANNIEEQSIHHGGTEKTRYRNESGSVRQLRRTFTIARHPQRSQKKWR